MKHRGYDSGGVCAAAESKYVDLISVPVVVHQEAVGIDDVVLQPVAKRQTCRSGKRTANPRPNSWRRACAYSWMVVDRLPIFILHQRVEELDDVRPVGRKLI
jgi:hypothetical protein